MLTNLLHSVFSRSLSVTSPLLSEDQLMNEEEWRAAQAIMPYARRRAVTSHSPPAASGSPADSAKQQQQQQHVLSVKQLKQLVQAMKKFGDVDKAIKELRESPAVWAEGVSVDQIKQAAEAVKLECHRAVQEQVRPRCSTWR